jgi:hypothetical protein
MFVFSRTVTWWPGNEDDFLVFCGLSAQSRQKDRKTGGD